MSVRVKAVSSSEADKIVQSIKENKGYCPCKIQRTEDTKCMCKEFRNEILKTKEEEDISIKTCHCGLYTVTWEK